MVWWSNSMTEFAATNQWIITTSLLMHWSYCSLVLSHQNDALHFDGNKILQFPFKGFYFHCHDNRNELSFILNCSIPLKTHIVIFACQLRPHKNNKKLRFSIKSCNFFLSNNSRVGIILCMGSTNEKRCYIVALSLVDWAHTQNDTCRAVVAS